MGARLRRERAGQLHVGDDVEISAFIGLARHGHALTLDPELLAVLRRRRHFQANGAAGERGHHRFAAEHRGRQRHLDARRQIVAVALETAVRQHLHAQVEIAGASAAGAGLALAGDAHPRAVADAGRDAHVDGPRMAVVLQRDPAQRAVVRLVERELDGVLEVGADAGPAAAARAPLLAIGRATAAEERREEVGETAAAAAEQFFHLLLRYGPILAAAAGRVSAGPPALEAAEAAEPAWEALRARRHVLVGAPVGAELVVLAALVGVAEHLVGFVDLLEARFGHLVPGVHVRVVLAGQLAVGLLDLLVGGRLGEPQRRVIVLEVHALRAPAGWSADGDRRTACAAASAATARRRSRSACRARRPRWPAAAARRPG